MKGAFVELAAIDVVLLVMIFVCVSASCCYLGARLAQYDCRCKICKGVIHLGETLGAGRFGSVPNLKLTVYLGTENFRARSRHRGHH